MGKKSTTIQTGLGDDQYKSLADNQANIATGVNDLSTKATDGFNTITANQQQMTDNQTTLYDQAETNTTKIVGNQDALSTGQADILSAVRSAPKVDLSGVTSSINSLEGTTTAGFNTMGGRFDTVDQSLAGLGTQVTDGFTGVNTGIEALSGDVATGFEGVNTGITSGFEAAETNADARAVEAQTQRDALQEAVLTGQVGLTELVSKYGEAGATYYENLAGNQAAMTEQLGGMQDGLSAFQDQYSTDFETQSQFLGDLAGTVEGGFDAVREGQTNVSDSLANQFASSIAPQAAATQQQFEFNNQMQTQLANINANIQAGNIDYGEIAKQVSLGQSSGNDTLDAMAQQEWTSSLNTIRSLLTDQTMNIDDRLRDNYSQLSNSFDAQGRLVSSSVDQNGVSTARAIDENGQLLIAQFDQTGQQLMKNSLDINSMMQGFKSQFSGGANYSMGNLSPANNQRFGLMSPMTRTGRR